MPYETDAPLVIDADTVLPPAVALQRFEPVPGGNPQTGQLSSGMQLQELSPCHTFNVLEPGHTLAAEKRLGIGTTERVEHVRIFFCVAESVKQTKKCADDSGMKSDTAALRSSLVAAAEPGAKAAGFQETRRERWSSRRGSGERLPPVGQQVAGRFQADVQPHEGGARAPIGHAARRAHIGPRHEAFVAAPRRAAPEQRQRIDEALDRRVPDAGLELEREQPVGASAIALP